MSYQVGNNQFFLILYGSDVWIMGKQAKRKINSYEMWCYGRMLRTDSVRNEEVLGRVEERISL